MLSCTTATYVSTRSFPKGRRNFCSPVVYLHSFIIDVLYPHYVFSAITTKYIGTKLYLSESKWHEGMLSIHELRYFNKRIYSEHSLKIKNLYVSHFLTQIWYFDFSKHDILQAYWIQCWLRIHCCFVNCNVFSIFHWASAFNIGDNNC